MVKGLYQLPPKNLMKLLHSNIWWFDGLVFLDKGLLC